MHKLLSTIVATFLFVNVLSAQNVTKYVLTEHFTNTKCSVCASRNPAFFTLIGQHESEVHHISYHPSVPYNTCLFYLENTTENNQRTSFYDIFGTPRVALNGTLVPLASQLLPTATLNAELGKTSPVYVQVQENASTVTVNVHTVGDKPTGSYQLFVAFAEKEINYNAPNGENLHHNVFRKMLTNINGDNITLAEKGQSVQFQFARPSDPDWNPAQMYALAWVQNTQDQSVLNSGTKFDPVVSGVDEIVDNNIQIVPNPATDHLTAAIDNDQPQSVELISIDGSVVKTNYTINSNQIGISTEALSPGIYLLRVRGEKSTFTGKFVKI